MATPTQIANQRAVIVATGAQEANQRTAVMVTRGHLIQTQRETTSATSVIKITLVSHCCLRRCLKQVEEELVNQGVLV